MIQKAFEKTKNDILAALGAVDYSPKGSVDHEIVPLINLVNRHPRLVTTSSCAGRVSIFIEGSKDNKRIGGKGDGGHWLFFTHDPIKVNSGWQAGLAAYTHPERLHGPRRYVLYKFEPFILHVKCHDHAIACQLFSLALSCGFRESGIGPNDNVAIRISMRIDAPIGYLEDAKIKQIVPPEYLDELNRMALDLFVKNSRRIDEFTEKFRDFLSSPIISHETKDERRLRKQQAGLAKQQEQLGRSSQRHSALEPESELLTEIFN